MRTIAIKDLKVCETLDKKSMANLRGGLNNVGYESNNSPARSGIVQTQNLRTAILAVRTNPVTHRLERLLQDVNLVTREEGSNIRVEAVLF